MHLHGEDPQVSETSLVSLKVNEFPTTSRLQACQPQPQTEADRPQPGGLRLPEARMQTEEEEGPLDRGEQSLQRGKRQAILGHRIRSGSLGNTRGEGSGPLN